MLSLVQIYYYVNQEANIYIWDYFQYWNRWSYYIDNFDNVIDTLPFIIESVQVNTLYNNSPVLFLWLAKYLPFDSRVNYIIGIYIFVYLIVIYLCFYIVKKIYKEKLRDSDTYLFFCLLCFYPPFWMPLLRGYIDMVGLIPILISIIFCIRVDFSCNSILINIRNILIMAFLLWMPILLRRWYIFTVIALYLCLPLLNLLLYKCVTIKNAIKVYGIFFIIGCVMSSLMVYFQPAFFETATSNNYAFSYKAYYEPILLSYLSLYNKIGLLTLLLFVLGIIFSFRIKIMDKIKAFNIFCFFMLVISFNIFIYIQSIGLHHALPYTLWIFFIVWMSCFILSKKYTFFSNALVIIWLSIFYVTFNDVSFRQSPSLYQELDLIKTPHILPEQKLPLYIDEVFLPNYLELINDLRSNVTDKQVISVIGSNQAFSADLVRLLSGNTLPIIYSSQIDFRDDIDMRLFAEYVVITDPILIHRKNYQCVITVAGELLLSEEGIGQRYQKINKEYDLDAGIKAYIFKKIGQFSEDDIDKYLSKMSECHPSEWDKNYMQTVKDKILFDMSAK